jgi:aspartyl-tRNA(Asn)/glutamyl-tRNA(Gln) amidotransferase subunit C
VSVGPADIRRIADLAALEVSDRDLPGLAHDLTRILEYISQLERADATAVEPFRPGPVRAPFRADKVGSVPLQRRLEDFAPDFRDGFFILPRVEGVGGEE